MQARFKPIISMLEDIFTSVMCRVGKKHDLSKNLDRQICPRIMRKLQKLKDNSRFWQARAAGNGKYSVFHGFKGYVVSIVDKTCTCRVWELSGIPCVHAIAVMREEMHNVEDFVHEFYSVAMYKKAFANAINPVNGRNQWVKQDVPTFLPPQFDVSLKNLAFKRRSEEGENSNKKVQTSERMSRKGHHKTCSRCGVSGHTKRTCSQQV